MTTDLPDGEAALLAATIKVQDLESVPKENQTEYCLSCGAATPQLYCGECGLKNDDLRRSLWKLIGETLGGIFSFESRMWRTWAALLFKPGKVAREFADGARTKYSAPIRVYLVVTFLLLLYLAVTQTNLFAVAVSPKTPEQIAAQELQAKALSEAAEQNDDEAQIPQIEEKLKAVRDAAKSDDTEALDEALGEVLEDARDLTAEQLENNISFNNYNFEVLFFQPQSKFKELMDKSAAEGFVENLNNREDPTAVGFDGQAFDVKKAMTVFLTNPNRFNQQFNIWLPRAMFLMVPMVMFLGVIYIRGPNALLYDHLIHAIFIHSVFFFSLLVAILMSKVISGGTVANILLVFLLIYLPLSLKRMFGRGWIKTIWTTLNIGFIYLLMLLSTLITISVYSLWSLAA